MTHQRTPFALLEQVALDADTAQALAQDLRARPGIEGAIVLATCNRTEVYLDAGTEHADTALRVLAHHARVPAAQLRDIAMVRTGDDASRHLFRVAAGLESRVIGEAEILGQVRAAAAQAGDDRTAGHALAGLFRWAAATGRRARRDTGGSSPPSLARTAIDAAGPLRADARIIVLGAGAMAAAITQELRSRRLPYVVAARRRDQAARLTRRPHEAIPIDQLPHHLGHADLIVCATSARTPVLLRYAVARARNASTAPHLTVIDLSMPRNVEQTVGDLDQVELIHLDQLHGSGGDLHARRVGEAVSREHERYRLWLAGQAAGPVIAALRDHVTQHCVDEARRHLPPDEAAKLARRVAGKMLHAPTIALKELSARGDREALDVLAAALGAQVPARGDSLPAAS